MWGEGAMDGLFYSVAKARSWQASDVILSESFSL
jgi:hypothetical protein